MKKKSLVAFALIAASIAHVAPEVCAKTPTPESAKVGYTNAEYILSLLPEFKKVQSEIRTFEKQIKRQVEAKLQELEKKLQDFQQNSEKLSKAVKSQRQAELQKLYEEVELFKNDVQKKLTQKQTSLIDPLYDKVQKTIEQVAKEHGYTCIINANVGGMPILLYTVPRHDISNLILQKLGVTLKKEKTKTKKSK